MPLWRMREALDRGETSAAELVEAHLAEIERTNPRVNAFIEIYADEARQRAREPLEGPLAGVPVTVKDSFDLAGRVTWCGSLLRRQERAARDSNAAARLKAAGAIVIGKTSTPEFLYYYETDNRIIGRTCHPLDPSKTPGGSSGGEAAAIAACMSAGGIGSDGGGSIREPAHFCGICGLKPTPGRVGAGGHWPVIGHPAGFMGVGGPMARTARDVRILFETLAGMDVRDPFSAPVPVRQPAGRSRLAVWRMNGVQAECSAAVEKAARLLAGAGCAAEEFDAALLAGAHELWRVLFVDLITQSLRAMIAGREDECAWTGVELMKEAREQVSTERLLAVLGERDAMRAPARADGRGNGDPGAGLRHDGVSAPAAADADSRGGAAAHAGQPAGPAGDGRARRRRPRWHARGRPAHRRAMGGRAPVGRRRGARGGAGREVARRKPRRRRRRAMNGPRHGRKGSRRSILAGSNSMPKPGPSGSSIFPCTGTGGRFSKK